VRLANLRCRSPAGSPRRGSVLIRHARRADGARRAITSLGLGRLKAASDLGGSLPAQVIATRLFDALDDIRRQRPLIAERLELASELLSSLLPSWSGTGHRVGCLSVAAVAAGAPASCLHADLARLGLL